jgi:acetyl-CoA carboxylase, biotin carboxylase subunit
MVMKVMAHANSRIEAIDRLYDALGRLEIEGITTNVNMLRAVLEHPNFRAGDLGTDFLVKFEKDLLQQPQSAGESLGRTNIEKLSA